MLYALLYACRIYETFCEFKADQPSRSLCQTRLKHLPHDSALLQSGHVPLGTDQGYRELVVEDHVTNVRHFCRTGRFLGRRDWKSHATTNPRFRVQGRFGSLSKNRKGYLLSLILWKRTSFSYHIRQEQHIISSVAHNKQTPLQIPSKGNGRDPIVCNQEWRIQSMDMVPLTIQQKQQQHHQQQQQRADGRFILVATRLSKSTKPSWPNSMLQKAGGWLYC